MRRKRRNQTTPQQQTTAQFRNRPFRGMARTHARPHEDRTAPPLAAAAPPAAPAAAEIGDGELFRNEMADVTPLPAGQRARVPAPAHHRRTTEARNADAEALAELSELVAGAGKFDIMDTTEFVEGSVAGVDRRLIRRLRGGHFAYQAHLDLHGMTVPEADAAVDRFLTQAYRSGKRCVLIIHGKGLNSAARVPVLKTHVVDRLARGRWARVVLAFTSARPCDGGVGALYVLLRRRRRRKEFIRVTEGAHW